VEGNKNTAAVAAAATTLCPFNGLFSRTTWVRRYQKGKSSLDLNEARDDVVLGCSAHQLDHMQTICTSLQTGNHTDTLSLHIYRPDALSKAQPTVSSTAGITNRIRIICSNDRRPESAVSVDGQRRCSPERSQYSIAAVSATSGERMNFLHKP